MIDFQPTKINFQPASEIPKEKLKTGVSGFGQIMGTAIATGGVKSELNTQLQTDDMTNALAIQISKMKKEGKDTSRAEQQYKVLTGNDLFSGGVAQTGNYDTTKIYGEAAGKTNKQIIGEGVSTVGVTLLGSGAGTVVKRLAFGAAEGGVAGLGSSLQENKTTQENIKDTLKGASIGLTVSGFFEGLGYGLRKLSESRAILNKTANTYNKELQPSAKEIASSIEKTPAGEAFKTIGVQVRDAVDDAGKPLYVGTYRTINDTAKRTVANKGKQLESLLTKYDDTVKINKNEIPGDVISEMQDRMGTLSKSELNIITKEINRIGESEITPTQALKYKRLYDSKIPDSFWADTGDRLKSIAVQTRYILRDNLRKLINEKTGDATIKTLNQSMGLAMDVRRLSSSQLAQRALLKVGGQGGVSPFKFVYEKLIDDFIFNPALTTRSAQALKSMGSQTGQTATRKLIRNTAIQTLSK